MAVCAGLLPRDPICGDVFKAVFDVFCLGALVAFVVLVPAVVGDCPVAALDLSRDCCEDKDFDTTADCAAFLSVVVGKMACAGIVLAVVAMLVDVGAGAGAGAGAGVSVVVFAGVGVFLGFVTDTSTGTETVAAMLFEDVIEVATDGGKVASVLPEAGTAVEFLTLVVGTVPGIPVSETDAVNIKEEAADKASAFSLDSSAFIVR